MAIRDGAAAIACRLPHAEIYSAACKDYWILRPIRLDVS
jgi:hypothetical protein